MEHTAQRWLFTNETCNTNIKNKKVLSLCQLNVCTYIYTAPNKILLKTLHKDSDVSQFQVGYFMGKHKHVNYISCITALGNIWACCFIVMPHNRSHRYNYQCRLWLTHIMDDTPNLNDTRTFSQARLYLKTKTSTVYWNLLINKWHVCSCIIFFSLPNLSHLYRSNTRKYDIVQEKMCVIDKIRNTWAWAASAPRDRGSGDPAKNRTLNLLNME